MPNNKNNAPVKMSLGEFMGGEPTHELSALPTRPKERGPDDDGSFRRRDYNDDRREREISRSDGDNNWRRGGGGGGGGGGGDDYNDNRREPEINRSDGDNNWRRGGGNTGSSLRDFDDRRGGGNTGGSLRDFDDRRGSGYDRRGGGGGYSRDYDNKDRDSGFDRRGGGGFENRNSTDRNGGPMDNRDNRGRSDYGRGNSGFDHGRLGNDRGSDGGVDGPLRQGVRPKLQLKSRTAPIAKVEKKKDVVVNDVKDTKASNEENVDKTKENEEEEKLSHMNNTVSADATVGEIVSSKSKEIVDDKAVSKKGDEEKKIAKKPEPEIVNSRAAALESAPNVKRDPNNVNRSDKRNKPPPVLNKRFEQLAVEEREKHKEFESRRQTDNRIGDSVPPPVVNSRFAAAAEADRDYNRDRDNANRRMDDSGPPPVVNSRFAAAAEADRDYNRDRDNANRRMDDSGPPPVVNSRFAAAAEADRDYNRDRDNANRRMDDIGPPPVVNSRFAAAAAADRDRSSNHDQDRDGSDSRMDNRGPPPVANSRFAAAVEADRSYNRDHDNNSTRMDNHGPPPVANSRFAAAAEADRDRSYNRDRENTGGYMDDNRDRNGRVSRQNDYEGDRRGYGVGSRYDESQEHQTHQEPSKSSVADLLKPKARPLEENILKVPNKEQSDNFLRPITKHENSLDPPSKGKSVTTNQMDTSMSQVIDDSDILAAFASGSKLGKDLLTWIGSLSVVPRVEKLVFHLLTETDKSNPDIECAWADPAMYGNALVSLVEDDLLKQMEVLFAVQKYCDTLDMPKINGEYLVQAMFRAMYKYDLADDETFMLWKEDESTEHEAGKLKAVIQTVEWFNWLEEEDEEDEEEEE